MDKELLDILACPKCKGDVEYMKMDVKYGEGLLCRSCGLFYVVKDNIPVMLIEESIKY
ncbi:MAG: Trm112 family protein [Candidatus Magnetoovum sp. WYHC-5]|nr:Trm112 family protein [Candidatus Magnetoovum sp. WYHC-5]